MPHAEARVQTRNPSRYLVHLCRHAQKFGDRLQHLHGGAGSSEGPEVLDVEWTDSDGTLRLSSGTCTLHADVDTLTVRVEAADEASLERVRDIVTADLERFGRRDHLTVTWTRPDSGAVTSRW